MSRFQYEGELKTSSLREKSSYTWATSKSQISTKEKTFFRSKCCPEMRSFVLFWIIHHIFGSKCPILVKFEQKIKKKLKFIILYFVCFQIKYKSCLQTWKIRWKCAKTILLSGIFVDFERECKGWFNILFTLNNYEILFAKL